VRNGRVVERDGGHDSVALGIIPPAAFGLLLSAEPTREIVSTLTAIRVEFPTGGKIMQAPRIMIVTPQKTGTHLMLELALATGYKAFGVIRASARTEPQFDAEQRLQIARLVFSETEVRDLEKQEADEFTRRTDEAWSALAWSWQRRLGQPVAARYGQAKYDSVDLVASNPKMSKTTFADTPPGMCWLWHELDVNAIDGSFIEEWASTGEPRIIFNYRDPRDVLVSMINFVDVENHLEYGNFCDRRIYNAIFRNMNSISEKISFAIRDRYFPIQLEFEKCLWMLYHPNVCKVRYEDLVGPEGGGSKERQHATVERILAHIDADVAPETICNRLYNTNAWSFRKGRPGAWRKTFNNANLRQFYAAYDDLLEQYGYE
jgi:hypothetical protein